MPMIVSRMGERVRQEGLIPVPGDDGAAPLSPRRSTRLLVEGSGRDLTFPSRVEALLRSAPILRLQSLVRHQLWAAGEVADRVDVVTLALAALDEVMSRQGLEREATPADVVVVVSDLLGEQAPDLAEGDRRAAAGWVLDVLLNHENAGQPFEYPVWDHTAAPPTKRVAKFRLLEQKEDPATGLVVLHATADAVNALAAGLQYDVEDAMAASEFVLARQLQRGAFGSAEATAVQALRLSQQYSTEIRRIVTETRRDLRSVQGEWADGMGDRLSRARSHLSERLTAERTLLTTLADHVAADDPDVAAASARIVRLVEDATGRHTSLHADVMRARAVFLAEQERQGFRPAVDGLRVDVSDEVLLPTLRLPADRAVLVSDAFAERSAEPQTDRVRVPMLVRVADMWWEEPAAPRDHDDHDDGELELADAAPPAIPDSVVVAARRVIAAADLPVRLSALLTAVGDDDSLHDGERALCSALVSLSVLWAFSPDDVDDEAGLGLAAAVLGSDVVAVADGTPLMLNGFDGDDLLIVAAGKQAAPHVPIGGDVT